MLLARRSDCFRHEALETFVSRTDCVWAMAVSADCLDGFNVGENPNANF